ncbi:hypothetical protein BDN72DRAFT_170236 [Pluteus cervinus]|uniref:Uncharacterized protein n=1 Tax=Pluteus cervinus TaxID=181527 RepID=A0ACD3AKG3_9AGAR|nr:hypothetical protein BDN72DRAFT_170236 [Pluteus cervinus]
MSDTSSSDADIQADRACFQGVTIATLCYGALVMIFLQLFSVLLGTPKRGRIFWGLLIYASLLLPVASLAVGTTLKFTQMALIDNRNYPGGPLAWFIASTGNNLNVIGLACVTIFPWISDLLMFYRVLVLWNGQLWLLMVGGPLYLARISLSVPYLITNTHPNNPSWLLPVRSFGIAYSSLSACLNLFFTLTIAYRIWSLRPRLNTVLGTVAASHYVSFMTISTESAAFFTLWAIINLVSDSWGYIGNDVFLKPSFFISAITRMLIALRMAENRAWTRDIVKAAHTGVLDWEVSSSTSITLPDPTGSMASSPSITSPEKSHIMSAHHVQMQHLQLHGQKIPKQFRADFPSM